MAVLCALVLLALQVSGVSRGFWCHCDGDLSLTVSARCVLPAGSGEQPQGDQRQEHISVRDDLAAAPSGNLNVPAAAAMDLGAGWWLGTWTVCPAAELAPPLAVEAAPERSLVLPARIAIGQSVSLLI